MCYYHLDQGWDFLNTVFWPSNPINSSDDIISFNPDSKISSIPIIEANTDMIEYSTLSSYTPLAGYYDWGVSICS
jgi:hypothetical protein